MRARAVLAALGVVVMLTGLPAPASAAVSRPVSIESFQFVPGTITAAMGVTVKWTNNDGAPHTATSDDPLPNGKPGVHVFGSGGLDFGESFQRRLPWAGTFTYHCVYHFGMNARVSTRMTVTDVSTENVVQYRVRWALDDPRAGTEFDVQARAPGGKFVNWYRGMLRSKLFTPDADGTWSFRARLVQVDGSAVKASTLYSPAASVDVTLR
jgi:plastocyanin